MPKDFQETVMTPNKGQLIFHDIRSNKGKFRTSIFEIQREIGDFLP